MLSDTLGKRLYSRTFPPGATVSPPLHYLRRQHQLWSGVTNFSHPFLFGFYPKGLMSPIGFLPIGENAANGQPGGCASSSMCCAETARSLLCRTARLQLANYRHQRGSRSSKMLSKAAPQPSPGTAVADPLQPRETETMPAAGIAASPEQIETQVEPSSQTAPIAPEKMTRPAAVAKALTPKTAARVAMPRRGVRAKFGRSQSLPIANTAKPKRPASTVTAQPMQATDSQGGGREPDALGDLLRGLFGNVR